jgi:hypothetical protein
VSYRHGEYIPICWDSEPYEVTPEYIKGHVAESEARSALESHERGYGEGPMTLRHLYGRWVFSASDEYDRELRIYSAPQRGAFALTEVRHVKQGAAPEVPRG